ncbi:hypothetical protein EZV62_016990 [Acer yangbiense]|uniref:AAA+ ATPase domain-containing protein n=1 Tax=Acer yangbiense TaxID=1000413 RepID=A0A5C7HQ50_9ROSI|nr:hypothetical protein EZV62_016990 [Acer yangbiense]
MAELVISIASKVTELLIGPIRRQICYVFKYQSNMDELRKQAEKLKNVRAMVQHSVEEATRQGDEIETDVVKWMDSVDEFTNGVIIPIIDDQDKANKRCFIGLCPNLIHYSLSKKAVKTTRDGVNLLAEGRFQRVSYRTPLQRIVYNDFDSRMPIFNDLMESLMDADVNLIGVYGMGGVGKTTLVRRVVGQAIEDELFDAVVMAEVTKTPDIKNIQAQIADQLGLTFQEESLSGRADRLRDRLKKEKRVLVVLDDVWAKLDLEAVGIPVGEKDKVSTLQEEEQKGRNDDKSQRLCKILLTSRNLDVLRDDMNTQKNFFVEILSVEEAENLFWKILGHSEEKPDLDPVAVEIVGMCAGLPVAIATIASALKNKSLSIWKNTLEQLRTFNPRSIQGMDANVYSTIELSYNLLESEEAKSLFLLCSLLRSFQNASSNISFDYLLRYGMGLGLFQDVYTLEQGRNKLHMLINILKDSILLLDGNTNEDIIMHDLIHVVAVSIASKDKHMFNIQDVAGLKEMLEEKLPKDSSAVSLLHRDIHELPEKLEFPKLKLFLLNMEDASIEIPDAFFEGANSLKVLGINGIHLLSPPSSLCCLKNLHTLSLDCCQLGNVAVIGELKELEILSFWKSDIEQLPTEIRQLTRLRLLDLSDCSKLKVIRPNVISSLTLLEELFMGNSFVQWDVEGQSNASLVELKQLSRLTTVDVQVPNAQIISQPQDLSFGNLERFRIFIGEVWDWSDKYDTSKTVKLELSSSNYLSNGIKSLLNITEDVHLDKLKGVKSVVYELNGKGFPQLKHLHVQNGSEIQYIANSIGEDLCIVFPLLESLFLNNLINLEKICYGQLAAMSFSKLRIVKVERCDRLKYLFSFSMAKNFFQLQEIELTDCKKLEEIFFEESEELVHQDDNLRKIEFTQLHTLTLKSLPQLTSFGFNAFGSQEIIAEDEVADFTPVSSENVVLPNLVNLKLSSMNIGCAWLDQLPVVSSCCQTLTSLTLEECSGNLKFLFSYSSAKSLVLLQKLEIRNCKSIEGIINTEEFGEDGRMIQKIFPKLINLQLKCLPELTLFGSGNSVEFPSLTQLSIEDCPKFKTFFSALMSGDIKQSNEVEEMNRQVDIYPLFNEKVGFPSLEKMVISGMDNLESIWHSQFLGDSFNNLKSVEVNDCQELMTIFPSRICERLLRLESLTVKSCGSVIEIFDLRGINLKEKHSIKTTPQLRELYVDHMTNLKHIWNEDPKGMLSYRKLEKVTIFLCPNLEYLFPASAAKSLLNLDSLEVSDCGVEEIIAKGGGVKEAADRFLFPKLSSLQLHNLPRLRTFYPGHTVEGPCLKRLGLHHCDKVKLFISEFLGFFETIEEGQHDLSPPFFLVREFEGMNQGSPKLEELQLSGKVITMEWPDQVPRHVFRSLESLELNDHESTVLPLDFIQRFDSLGKLSLNSSSYEEIFSYGAVKEHPQIKHLVLSGLFDLKQIWKQGSKIHLNFQNLEILEVRSCFNLINLMPSSASFQNLLILEVWGCDGLKNLLTSSTAKSLVLLKKLEVFDCKILTEVVANEGAVPEEIVFGNLKSLSLVYLQSLASFCSTKHILNFPILESLVVNECPKMKIFSKGIMSTPKLHKLELNWKAIERSWEVGVNTTIQQNMEKRLLGREDCTYPSTKPSELADSSI